METPAERITGFLASNASRVMDLLIAWDKDKKMLCESRPKVLYDPGPCVFLKPVLLTDIKEYPHYSCPVYRTAERRGVLATTGHSTNFLMMMKMPTDVDPDHWAMRGVAMLCSLKD